MLDTLTILAASESAEPQGIAALGLDPLTILVQGITFLVFFLIIKKFALGKIVGTLEARRQSIEGSLDKAEELQRKNAEAEQRVNEQLAKARKESEAIIDRGRKEAAEIVAEAQKEASTKAEKLLEDGKLQIEAEVIKARQTLKKETLGLVAEATAAVLAESVDAKKNEVLIKKALQEMK